MSYTKNVWKNSGEAGAIPINATNLNHMEDGIKSANDGLVGTAKPTVITVTLNAASWVGSGYQVSHASIGASDIVEITPTNNIRAFALGIIGSVDQGAGYITLTSYGTVPTVDITVSIVIWKVVS